MSDVQRSQHSTLDALFTLRGRLTNLPPLAQRFWKMYKRFDARSLFSSAAVQLTPVPFSSLHNQSLVPLLSAFALSYDSLRPHVPQSASHFPHHRRTLCRHLGCSRRPRTCPRVATIHSLLDSEAQAKAQAQARGARFSTITYRGVNHSPPTYG